MFTDFGKVVIFGGTGTIGTVFTEVIREIYPEVEIYLATNNEHEIWEADHKYKDDQNIQLIFADIRDRSELEKIFINLNPDVVINCAALKHVNYCEKYIINTIKTNILGLENLLYLSNEYAADHFLQISTDKVVEPISVMGATKMLGEKLCREWNKTDGFDVSCIRLGNVIDSRGSLIPTIDRLLETGSEVFYTDEKMYRYVITIKELKKFIKSVLHNMLGGEIFIPKIEEVNIVEFIESYLGSEYASVYELIKLTKIGRRKGEKFREKLYSDYEVVTDHTDYWRIFL